MENNIELFLKDYEGLRKYKEFIKDIDADFFFKFADYMIAKNKELQIGINKEYELGFSQGLYEEDEDWKERIKEKIEELEKEHEKYNGINGLEISRNGLINAQIQKLQELLN